MYVCVQSDKLIARESCLALEPANRRTKLLKKVFNEEDGRKIRESKTTCKRLSLVLACPCSVRHYNDVVFPPPVVRFGAVKHCNVYLSLSSGRRMWCCETL